MAVLPNIFLILECQKCHDYLINILTVIDTSVPWLLNCETLIYGDCVLKSMAKSPLFPLSNDI